MMTDDPKIVPFPVPDEERARRLQAEVGRLAQMSIAEWMFYVRDTDLARKLGVEKVTLEDMIKAVIRANDKKAKEDKADDRRTLQRVERKQQRDDQRVRQDAERVRKEAEKEAERARKEAERIEREQEARRKKREPVFAEIAALPQLTHETRLQEAAKHLGEDFETLFEEFGVYFAKRSIPDELTPWPEPVDTAALFGDIETKFRRYIVVSDAVAVATTLWTPFTYIIEIALHAPKLIFTFPDRNAGKTTATDVLFWMVLRGYKAVEASGAAIYRIVDRLKPTLILDDADTLFMRRTVLAHIINASWTNNKVNIPRVGPRDEILEFNPYSAQAINMKGVSLPDTTYSRCIHCLIWPKLATELVDKFNERDDEEFVAIRRKLMRWSVDNAVALRAATPECHQFNNRIRDNWELLFAIADLAGGEWPKRARTAALELEVDRDEPSEGIRLFAALRDLWGARDMILTADVCAALNADPDSEWHNFRGKGPISQVQLAALLKPYGIQPIPGQHPTKRSDKTRSVYRRTQFENAWLRLLQKPTKESNTQTFDPAPKSTTKRKTGRRKK
jgi:hypothetical protein